MDQNERISLREFARRLNTNDKSVRDAIKKKAIINGVEYKTNGQPRIVYEIALREWESWISLEGRESKIDFSAAKKETHIKREREGERPIAESGIVREANSTQKINHARAAIKLQMDSMELQKKKGQLVEKDKVNKELFEAGKEIRETLLTIPDRIVDDMLAADNRNEAHTLLYKEIEMSLEKLSRMEEKAKQETPVE